MSFISEASIWVGYNLCDIENEEFNMIKEEEGTYEACEHFGIEYPTHYDGLDIKIVGDKLYNVEQGPLEISTLDASMKINRAQKRLTLLFGQNPKVFLASEYL